VASQAVLKKNHTQTKQKNPTQNPTKPVRKACSVAGTALSHPSKAVQIQLQSHFFYYTVIVS